MNIKKKIYIWNNNKINKRFKKIKDKARKNSKKWFLQIMKMTRIV